MPTFPPAVISRPHSEAKARASTTSTATTRGPQRVKETSRARTRSFGVHGTRLYPRLEQVLLGELPFRLYAPSPLPTHALP